MKAGSQVVSGWEEPRMPFGRAILVVCVFLGIGPWAAWTQEIPTVTPEEIGYAITHFRVEDGLPLERVLELAQTKDGALWIGTDDAGFARFDGLRFRKFAPDNDPGLSDWEGTNLLVDSVGRLTFFFAHRLIQRDQDEFRSFDMPFPIGTLHPDPHKGVWVQSRENFTVKRFIDGQCHPFFDDGVPVRPGADFTDLAVDVKGRVWLASKSTGALYEIAPDGASPQVLERADWSGPVLARALVSSSDRSVGVLTTAGLFRHNDDQWELSRPFPESQRGRFRILRAIEDRDGALWFCDHDGNLLYWSEGAEPRIVIPPHRRKSEYINRIVTTTDGSIWLATHGGLWRLNRQPFQRVRMETSLEEPRVLSTAISNDGTVWLGTPRQLYWRRPTDRSPRPCILKSFRQLFTAADGGVWGHSYDGGELWHLDHIVGEESPREQLAFALPTPMHTLVDSPKLGMWIGTFEGTLFRVENGQLTPIPVPGMPDKAVIWKLLESPAGELLVLTGSGSVHRLAEGRWETLRDPSLSDAEINPELAVTSDGRLWLSEHKTGVLSWDNGRWNQLNPGRIDLPRKTIGLVSDEFGGLWWNTVSEGVCYLDTSADSSGARMQQFGISDGLPTLSGDGFDVGLVRDPEGRIWIPSAVGVSFIDPSVWKRRAAISRPAHVNLDRVALDDQTVAPLRTGAVVTVNPDVSRVEIGCSVVDLQAPQRAHLHYRLSGLDAEWIDAGARRTAYFQSLPPGRYSFEVRSVNQFLMTSEPRDLLTLIVQPHWWQTIWFRIGLGTALVFLAWIGYSARMRYFQRQQDLHHRFSRELINSQERERKRIAGELHDSLGQNLTVMKNRLVLQNLDKSEPNPEVQELVSLVSDTIQETRRISHNLRPFVLDRIGLTRAIEEMSRQISESTGLQVDLKTDNIDNLLSAENQINFYRVIQECLNNVVKHADASRVKLEVGRQDNEIVLRIKDDGRGFDAVRERNPVTATGGMGLSGVEERVHIMGGTVSWISARREGATVIATIPQSVSK